MSEKLNIHSALTKVIWLSKAVIRFAVGIPIGLLIGVVLAFIALAFIIGAPIEWGFGHKVIARNDLEEIRQGLESYIRRDPAYAIGVIVGAWMEYLFLLLFVLTR